MQNKLPDAPPRLGHAKFLADVGTRLANHRGRDLHDVGHFLHSERHHGEDANLEFAFSQGGLVVLNALNHIGIETLCKSSSPCESSYCGWFRPKSQILIATRRCLGSSQLSSPAFVPNDTTRKTPKPLSLPTPKK